MHRALCLASSGYEGYVGRMACEPQLAADVGEQACARPLPQQLAARSRPCLLHARATPSMQDATVATLRRTGIIDMSECMRRFGDGPAALGPWR